MQHGKSLLWTSLLFATLCGCSSNSTTPGTTTILVPKIGSTFTTSRISDPPDGSEPIITHAYIAQSNITEYGMPNCVALTTDNSDDTLYFSYSSNGDFLLYEPSDATWITFPFGSQKTIISNDSDGHGGTVTDTVTFVGTGSATIHGISYPTKKVEIRQVNTDGGFTSSSLRLYEFAPSIGFFTSETETYDGGGSIETLTDFTLN